MPKHAPCRLRLVRGRGPARGEPRVQRARHRRSRCRASASSSSSSRASTTCATRWRRSPSAASSALDASVIAAGLAKFLGVDRRFQILGDYHGAIVVDDYAHHPTEIRATLEAARGGYPDRRIVALFQPHLYSRTRDFAREFGEALLRGRRADRRADLRRARGAGRRRVRADHLRRRAEGIEFLDRSNAEIVNEMRRRLRPNDIFITMGAGDVHEIAEAARARGGRDEQLRHDRLALPPPARRRAAAPQPAAHPGAAAARHRCATSRWSRSSSSAAVWAYRHTQSERALRRADDRDRRRGAHAARGARSRHAALRRPEPVPDRHRSRAARPGGLGWVRRIDIEKKLPDTLRIKITEREPVALVRIGERLLYVDEEGVALRRAHPDASATPICRSSATRTAPSSRARVTLLRDAARARPRAVFARLRSVADSAARLRAVRPRARRGRLRERRRHRPRSGETSTPCCSAENNPKIEYADLRFADRVIVKSMSRDADGDS